jgi:hypothetical protein
MDSADHPVVLDEGSNRITEFLALPESLVVRRLVELEFKASDVCIVGARLFLFGLHDGRLVHELAWSGRLLQSFGNPFGPDNLIARQLLSRGRLACDARSAIIAIAAEELGEVRAYSLEGQLRWRSKLRSFREVEVHVNAEGGVERRVPTDGSHVVFAAAFMTSRNLAVQVGLRTSESMSARDLFATTTRILSARDGSEQLEQVSLPRLRGIRNGYGFAFGFGTYHYEIVGVHLSFPDGWR